MHRNSKDLVGAGVRRLHAVFVAAVDVDITTTQPTAAQVFDRDHPVVEDADAGGVAGGGMVQAACHVEGHIRRALRQQWPAPPSPTLKSSWKRARLPCATPATFRMARSRARHRSSAARHAQVGRAPWGNWGLFPLPPRRVQAAVRHTFRSPHGLEGCRNTGPRFVREPRACVLIECRGSRGAEPPDPPRRVPEPACACREAAPAAVPRPPASAAAGPSARSQSPCSPWAWP